MFLLSYPHTLINLLYPFIHRGFSYEGRVFLPTDSKSFLHGIYI